MPRIRLTVSALALILLSVLLLGWRPPAKPDNSSLPSLRGDQAIESLKQQGLYDSLEQALASTRYKVSLDSSSTDSKAFTARQIPRRALMLYSHPMESRSGLVYSRVRQSRGRAGKRL